MAFAKDSPTRKKLIELINQKKLHGNACEVGVQEGHFSRVVLDACPVKKLFMVDSWRYLANYQDIANRTDSRQALNMMMALQNTAPLAHRRSLICEMSVDAANTFSDEFFDWVYIDAAHDEVSVTADLKAWWPKVKKGGLICGDDFADITTEYSVMGVKSAVEKFCTENDLKFFELNDAVEMSQWVIEK